MSERSDGQVDEVGGPMIANRDANDLFVADTLERRFPKVHLRLISILRVQGAPLGMIPGTVDVWCRDYLLVQMAENRFVQFRYEPDNLVGEYRRLRADGAIRPTLPWLRSCVRSEVVLDGGNVVRVVVRRS